jgi:hypothetical protein
MTAQIIQFPRAWSRPGHWTDQHEYFFDHFRECDGLSLEEATAKVEAHIHRGRTIPGESGGERTLRMAQEAFQSLPVDPEELKIGRMVERMESLYDNPFTPEQQAIVRGIMRRVAEKHRGRKNEKIT